VDSGFDVKWRTRGQLAVEYIDRFQEAGIGALGILRAMTSRAAALLGVEKEGGSLRAGCPPTWWPRP
jgi:hypothetical protein